MPAVFASMAPRVGIFQNEVSFQPPSENTCSHYEFCVNRAVCRQRRKLRVNVLTPRPDVREPACTWGRIFHCLTLTGGQSEFAFQSTLQASGHAACSHLESSMERGQRKWRGSLENFLLPFPSSPPPPPFSTHHHRSTFYVFPSLFLKAFL